METVLHTGFLLIHLGLLALILYYKLTVDPDLHTSLFEMLMNGQGI